MRMIMSSIGSSSMVCFVCTAVLTCVHTVLLLSGVCSVLRLIQAAAAVGAFYLLRHEPEPGISGYYAFFFRLRFFMLDGTPYWLV